MAENALQTAKAEMARRQSLQAAQAELSRRQGTANPAAPEYQVPEGYTLHETDRGRFIESPQGQWTPIEVDGQVDEIAQRALEQNPKNLERATTINRRAQSINAGGDTSGGFANQFLRGAVGVGSYTDEVLGGAAGVLRGEGPQAGRQRALDIADAYEVAKPKTSLVANLAGGVASAAPLAVAAGPTIAASAPATVGGQALAGLGAGVVAGGIEGAVYGSGEGEGEGMGNSRLQNAGINAAIGAGTGGVLGTAAPYITAGGRQIAKKAIEMFRKSDASIIARELGVSPEAARVIRNAIDAGDDDAAIAAITRGGDSAMLADATAGTRSLVDTAAQAPGGAGTVARGAVNERVTAATRQMNSALDDALGAPQQLADMTDAVRQGTSSARSAAYDAAYAAPIDYSQGQGRAIESLMSRVPQSAIDRANALMRIRGEESAQIMARIGDDGRAAFEVMPDVRQLDYITRALRDVASESDGAGRLGGQTDMGMSLENLASQIRGNMRAAVPEYGAALDVAADAIGQRNSLDSGYDLLRAGTKRSDAARAVSSARGSEAEMTALRQGVRSYIDDVTANVSRTITDNHVEAREGIKILREMSSRAGREKLRTVLGRDATETLLDQIDEAATGFELRAAIAENSKTASRTMTNDAVREQTSGGALRTLAQGEPVNATKRLVQAITGETDEAQTLRQMGLYQEISEALVNTRGGLARRALGTIEDAINGQQLTERQAATVARVLVGGASGAVPSASREASNSLAIR